MADSFNHGFGHVRSMAKKKQGDMQVADRTQSAMQTMDLAMRVSEFDDLLRSVMIWKNCQKQAVFSKSRGRCFEE
jgi:hypothetical protein